MATFNPSYAAGLVEEAAPAFSDYVVSAAKQLGKRVLPYAGPIGMYATAIPLAIKTGWALGEKYGPIGQYVRARDAELQRQQQEVWDAQNRLAQQDAQRRAAEHKRAIFEGSTGATTTPVEYVSPFRPSWDLLSDNTWYPRAAAAAYLASKGMNNGEGNWFYYQDPSGGTYKLDYNQALDFLAANPEYRGAQTMPVPSHTTQLPNSTVIEYTSPSPTPVMYEEDIPGPLGPVPGPYSPPVPARNPGLPGIPYFPPQVDPGVIGDNPPSVESNLGEESVASSDDERIVIGHDGKKYREKNGQFEEIQDEPFEEEYEDLSSEGDPQEDPENEGEENNGQGDKNNKQSEENTPEDPEKSKKVSQKIVDYLQKMSKKDYVKKPYKFEKHVEGETPGEWFGKFSRNNIRRGIYGSPLFDAYLSSVADEDNDWTITSNVVKPVYHVIRGLFNGIGTSLNPYANKKSKSTEEKNDTTTNTEYGKLPSDSLYNKPATPNDTVNLKTGKAENQAKGASDPTMEDINKQILGLGFETETETEKDE